jgi:hypothetical protein
MCCCHLPAVAAMTSNPRFVEKQRDECWGVMPVANCGLTERVAVSLAVIRRLDSSDGSDVRLLITLDALPLAPGFLLLITF